MDSLSSRLFQRDSLAIKGNSMSVFVVMLVTLYYLNMYKRQCGSLGKRKQIKFEIYTLSDSHQAVGTSSAHLAI